MHTLLFTDTELSHGYHSCQQSIFVAINSQFSYFPCGFLKSDSWEINLFLLQGTITMAFLTKHLTNKFGQCTLSTFALHICLMLRSLKSLYRDSASGGKGQDFVVGSILVSVCVPAVFPNHVRAGAPDDSQWGKRVKGRPWMEGRVAISH